MPTNRFRKRKRKGKMKERKEKKGRRERGRTQETIQEILAHKNTWLEAKKKKNYINFMQVNAIVNNRIYRIPNAFAMEYI